MENEQEVITTLEAEKAAAEEAAAKAAAELAAQQDGGTPSGEQDTPFWQFWNNSTG